MAAACSQLEGSVWTGHKFYCNVFLSIVYVGVALWKVQSVMMSCDVIYNYLVMVAIYTADHVIVQWLRRLVTCHKPMM